MFDDDADCEDNDDGDDGNDGGSDDDKVIMSTVLSTRYPKKK